MGEDMLTYHKSNKQFFKDIKEITRKEFADAQSRLTGLKSTKVQEVLRAEEAAIEKRKSDMAGLLKKTSDK